MKYQVTSAEASKLLKKVLEEKALRLQEEAQSCVFNAAMGEDIESVRPAYDYEDTRRFVTVCDEKIRAIKHAVSAFNVRQSVADTGMTIDQVLVYIPQLSEKKNRLYSMQSRLPKQRTSATGLPNNALIDYQYANYSVEQVKKEYMEVSDELRRLQTALDAVNASATFEIELPE